MTRILYFFCAALFLSLSIKAQTPQKPTASEIHESIKS